MQQLLQGIPHIIVYINILIHSEIKAEYLHILEEVFKQLAKAELKVKKHKYKFMVPSVPYLGCIIDSKGLYRLPEKVEAIHQECDRAKVIPQVTYILWKIPA